MNELQSINWSLVLPVIILEFILLAVALVDLIRIKKTKGPKWAWALAIVFVSLIGPILYFVIGRKQD